MNDQTRRFDNRPSVLNCSVGNVPVADVIHIYLYFFLSFPFFRGYIPSVSELLQVATGHTTNASLCNLQYTRIDRVAVVHTGASGGETM